MPKDEYRTDCCKIHLGSEANDNPRLLNIRLGGGQMVVHYWNFPMNPCVRLLVGPSVCKLHYHAPIRALVPS